MRLNIYITRQNTLSLDAVPTRSQNELDWADLSGPNFIVACFNYDWN